MSNNTPFKGVLKGSLDFMQHFKFVNSWFRFLMLRTAYLVHALKIVNKPWSLFSELGNAGIKTFSDT